MRRRDSFEDDGRTVADMSGLERPGLFGRRSRSSRAEEKYPDEREKERNPWEEAPFTWKERLRYMGVALLAALSIAVVFLAGIAIIIWLITLYA